jgi:hypothetical protein
MRSWVFKLFLAAGVFAPTLRASAGGPFGVELDGLASFSTLAPFSDASTIFDPWIDPLTLNKLPVAALSVDNYPLLGQQAQSTSYLRAYPGWEEGTVGNRPVVSYTVTWDGGGVDANSMALQNVSFVNLAGTNFTSTVVDGVRHNSMLLPFQYDNLSGEGTLALWIDNSLAGTAAAVSNLHITPTQYINPQTGQAPLFREEFLRKISPFKVLRMMDWQQTTGGGLGDIPYTGGVFHDPRTVDWVSATADISDPDPANWQTVQGRATTTQFGRTGITGVPYEEILSLANVSKKDIWINIPDRATSNYVTQLGSLLNTSLTQPVNVYVEFSNELWNTQGNQRWLRVLEDAKADTTGLHPVIDGADPTNDLRTIYREAAKKLADFSTTLRAQVGPAAAARIRPVLAGQTPAPALLQYGLEYLASLRGVAPGVGTNLSDVLAGVAIAPYVGNDLGRDELVKTVANGTPVIGSNGQPVLDAGGQPILGPDATGKAQSLDNTPAEQTRYLNWLFPNLQTYVEGKLQGDVRATVQLASKYNLPVMSYEGGQHLIAFNSTFGQDLNADFKIQANRDPRMGMLYHELSQMWFQETGNQLFLQFSLSSPYSSFGSWGLTESVTQLSSPKWDALLDILAGDANLDGSVTFSDFQILESNFNVEHALWGQGDFNLDGVVDYADFLIFRNRFQPTAAPPVQAEMVDAFASANVPEPGVVGLMVVAGVAGLMGRRGRRG